MSRAMHLLDEALNIAGHGRKKKKDENENEPLLSDSKEDDTSEKAPKKTNQPNGTSHRGGVIDDDGDEKKESNPYEKPLTTSSSTTQSTRPLTMREKRFQTIYKGILDICLEFHEKEGLKKGLNLLTNETFLSLIKSMAQEYPKMFNFKIHSDLVTPLNNRKVIPLMVHSILHTSGHPSEPIPDESVLAQESNKLNLLIALRTLTRSRVGLDSLFTEPFHRWLVDLIESPFYSDNLKTQALAALANGCICNRQAIYPHAIKYDSAQKLVDSVIQKYPKNDEILFLAYHYLFYLTVNNDIAKSLYEVLPLFRTIFNHFLDRTEEWNDPLFWNIKENPLLESKAKVLNELLRVLFNFTMIEKHVIRYKLDKFEDSFTRKVVGRVACVLSVPLSSEVRLNMDKLRGNEGDGSGQNLYEYLLNKPGLITVKMGLCNVSLYDGDILAMNMDVRGSPGLCELMEFQILTQRGSFDKIKPICPLVIFLKTVVANNSKMRVAIKRYIFGEDAFPRDANDSDGEEDDDDDDDDDDDGGGEEGVKEDEVQMNAKYDFGSKDKISLKNLLINHLTSVDYNVKRMVGEFIFALCGDNQGEMTRLCGLGAAIGTFVDKGMPGFGHIGKKDSTNMDDIRRLTRKKKAQEKMNERITTPVKTPQTAWGKRQAAKEKAKKARKEARRLKRAQDKKKKEKENGGDKPDDHAPDPSTLD